jgi:hypothetical protein
MCGKVTSTRIMKSFASIFFALASLTGAAVAQVAQPVTAQNVKINRVAPAVLTTPEYTTDLPNKRFEKLKWLEIEAEFEVSKVELVDELTVKYYVLLNGKLYVGDVTHENIPKGNNRYSVMYMSPRALEKATDGKQLNSAMIENIWVVLDYKGQQMAIKAQTGNKPLPNMQQVTGQMLPKGETPFQVLWWDRYEAVKRGGTR